MTIESYNYNNEPSGRVDTLAMALDKCERLEKQLKIAVKTLKKIIKEDMYNLDEHRVFIEKKLKQIKELGDEI